MAEQVPWFEVSDHLPRYAATAGKGAKPVRTGRGVDGFGGNLRGRLIAYF